MPGIPVYDPSNALARGLDIPEGGAQAYGMAARHVSAELRVAGEGVSRAVETYGQHEVQQDNAATETAKAAAFDPLTEGINQALAKAPQGKEHDALTEYLGGPGAELINKIGADASTTEGQQRAAAARAELNSYAFRFGHASVSAISAVNVKNSINNGANVYAQAAGAGTMSLSDARANTQALVNSSIASAPNLSAEDQARVRDGVTTEKMHDIEWAYGKGLSERDPVALGEAIGAGALPTLTGREADDLKDHAMTFTRAGQAESKRQATEDFGAKSTAIMQSLIGPDGLLHPNPQATSAIFALGSHPGATYEPGAYRALVEMNKTITKDAAEGKVVSSDPAMYDHFTQQMQAGTLSTTDLDMARAGRRLSDHDYAVLRAGAEDMSRDPVRKDAYKQFGTFLSTVKSQFITKAGLLSLQASDPRDQQRWYNFEHDARAAFDQGYTDKTWKTLLDPHSGAFLGRMAAQQILNKKGAPWSVELFGTVQGGYRFTGHTPQEWNDKTKWIKE